MAFPVTQINEPSDAGGTTCQAGSLLVGFRAGGVVTVFDLGGGGAGGAGGAASGSTTGGGNGQRNGTASTAGTANTGGGGGGGCYNTPVGRAGGSGVVVVRYKI